MAARKPRAPAAPTVKPRAGLPPRDTQDLARLVGNALVGKGFAQEMRDFGRRPPPKKVHTTGVDIIDLILGCGGFLEGKVNILHGPFACGKTTLALETCAAIQANGGVAVFADIERKLDPDYAAALGVNMATLVWAKPRTIERAFAMFEQVCDLTRAQNPDVPIGLVYDSLNAGGSEREMSAAWDKADYDSNAKVFSQCFRKFLPIADDSRVYSLFISQIRAKIEERTPGPPGRFKRDSGPKEKIGVGFAPAYYASTILGFGQPKAKAAQGVTLKEGEGFSEGDKREGDLTRIVVKKNQTGRPFTVAEVPIIYGKGFDKAASLLLCCERLGFIVEANKTWITVASPSMTNAVKFQGRGGMRRLQEDDPMNFEALRFDVREKITSGQVVNIPIDEDEQAEAEAEEAEVKAAAEAESD